MVVVCEPITVWLNTCPPPEYWSWYSVITPFCFRGTTHVKDNDLGPSETLEKLRGVPGPANNQ